MMMYTHLIPFAKFYIWTRPHRFTSRDVRITLQNLAENEIKK